MNIQHNGINRGGRKVYRVKADHETKKADHLDEEPAEQVTLRFMGGRGDQDTGDYGKWRVSERYNLSNNQKFDSFKEARKEFEARTGQKPPQPEFEVNQ